MLPQTAVAHSLLRCMHCMSCKQPAATSPIYQSVCLCTCCNIPISQSVGQHDHGQVGSGSRKPPDVGFKAQCLSAYLRCPCMDQCVQACCAGGQCSGDLRCGTSLNGRRTCRESVPVKPVFPPFKPFPSVKPVEPAGVPVVYPVVKPINPAINKDGRK